MTLHDRNTIFACLCVFTLGILLGATLTAKFGLSSWTEWASAWGGLFAAVFSVTAASAGVAVAWLNATRPSRAARQVILYLLDERLAVIGEAWRICEKFVNGTREEAPGAVKLSLLLSSNLGNLYTALELTDTLTPLDKVNFNRLAKCLSGYESFIKKGAIRKKWKRSDIIRPGGVYLVTKFHFENIASAAEIFDPTLGRHFVGRRKFGPTFSSQPDLDRIKFFEALDRATGRSV